MSVLGEYPEAISNKEDLQIWNNAAFDNKSPSWSFKNPVSVTRNPSMDSSDSSISCKENQSPIGLTISKLKSPVVAVHPLHQSKPLKNLPIKIVLESRDEKTEEEIEIENEISRLVARLEAIRLERSELNSKNLEKQGKSMAVKKIQDSGFSRTKIQRRGFSLGPNEIMSATKSNSKSKQSGITPIQSTQNRRKSCFWKLDDIEEKEEEKMGFLRAKNSSVRQAVTTIGSKKGVKKDDSILGSIQPKKLFGEQSVPSKKPLKPGRVIASRYNQATVNSSMRKRSLTEVDRKPRWTEGRVKKKWEIPSEIAIPKRLDLDDDVDVNENVVLPVALPEVLPRIRAVRCVDETGRDSGPAKRVSELVGKKFYFGSVDEEGNGDEDEDERVCQKLSFDFEED